MLSDGSRPIALDLLGNLLAPCVAAFACMRASRRTTDRLRAYWQLLGVFAGTWVLGQLAWAWLEVVGHDPVPFPGLPDVGYVTGVPFVMAAVLLHPDAPRLAAGRLRLVVDALLVGASLLALSWRLVLRQGFLSYGPHGFAGAVGLAYPLLVVGLLTVLVLVAARARRQENRSFAFVALGLLVVVGGHLVHGVLVQQGSWQLGNPVDAAPVFGFLLLAVGAHAESGRAWVRAGDRSSPVTSALLSYLPIVAIFVVVVVDLTHGRTFGGFGRLLGGVIFVSVLVRQLLALLDNGRLTRGLEATVAERTQALRESTDRLQQQAWSDPLTGLPNRALLYERIEGALQGGGFAVALLDLDGFKTINDNLGHAAGDTLLSVVGDRLMTQVLPGSTVARLGGDEFAFLLQGCRDEQHARALGEAILRALTVPVTLGSRSLALTGSLGIVLSVAGDTADSLLRNADVAMYAAKEAGKNRVRMFEPAMHEELLARFALEADLRAALVAREVVPWFQPVVNLLDGRIIGVEALARWPRENGLVSPGVFVPLAEQCGLVSMLGRQILRASCEQAAVWNREAPLTLSVNLSAVQVASDDLVDQVREALLDSGLPPEQLVLEITETVVMEDVEAVVPRLAALRALGIRIALDDFGTGYSALGYLQRLPVDIVKIDTAFVREIHLGARQSALAAAVMTVAASFELDVIAEGIELPEQADRLVELGVRLAQGFLYAPALPPQEISTLLWAQREEWVPRSA